GLRREAARHQSCSSPGRRVLRHADCGTVTRRFLDARVGKAMDATSISESTTPFVGSSLPQWEKRGYGRRLVESRASNPRGRVKKRQLIFRLFCLFWPAMVVLRAYSH